MNPLVKLQAELSQWDDAKIQLLKDTICIGATDDELALSLQVIQRTGLDPFARQIYFIKRWNKDLGKESLAAQVSIDGFRLVAQRTGKYAGQLGPFWCDNDGKWVDVWLGKTPPQAAKVGVLHQDFKEPLWRVARLSTYIQTGKNGPIGLWGKGPDLMLAKCAEALALRSAFPQELSGLYIGDEMGAEEREINPLPPQTDIQRAQAEFEAKNGIGQPVEKPPKPPKAPPPKTLTAEQSAKLARIKKMPEDVQQHFRAKGLKMPEIIKIMDDNMIEGCDDPEALRGWVAQNPIEARPVMVEQGEEGMSNDTHS